MIQTEREGGREGGRERKREREREREREVPQYMRVNCIPHNAEFHIRRSFPNITQGTGFTIDTFQ